MASHHLPSWSYHQKQWASANMAAMWKRDKQAYYQSPKQLTGTVQNKPPQGAAPTFLLTASMSVTCAPTNKHKNGSVSLCTPVLSCGGLTYSESTAEEVTESFEGRNQVLWSLEKARVITIALALPFQKGRYFFPRFIPVRLKGSSSFTKQSLEKKNNYYSLPLLCA